jgi:polyhydroxyalkanoate synthesis repressor PhaR
VTTKPTHKIVLKKYANRRLYDTRNSAYVTLNEVAELIKQGHEIQALDAKTKEDVTAFILTQIVLEEARRNNTLLPVALLHTIIRYGENVLVEFFQNHLENTIQSYLTYKSQVDEQFQRWLKLGMDWSSIARKSVTGMGSFQNVFDATRQDKDRKSEDESGPNERSN